MIEFKGYIFGEAEKHFQKKNAVFGAKALLFGMILFLPVMVLLARRFDSWAILVTYFSFMVIFPLLCFIPQSQKKRKRYLPKRIFTEDDCIICIADGYAETRYIEDVKEVRDYGTFYDIIFPYGKISDKFVCQKELLTAGTLEEFEALFGGKMVRDE